MTHVISAERLAEIIAAKPGSFEGLVDSGDHFCQLARSAYEELKIAHNANPERYPFSRIERVRRAIEAVEFLVERAKAKEQ